MGIFSRLFGSRRRTAPTFSEVMSRQPRPAGSGPEARSGTKAAAGAGVRDPGGAAATTVKPKRRSPVRRAAPTSGRNERRAPSANAAPKPAPPARPYVETLGRNSARAPRQYWEIRRWKRKNDVMYLGYFKAGKHRWHGVVKWATKWDYGIYVHDLPQAVLDGPHGGCFTEVRPGKFHVHFAVEPDNVNQAIFYVETLLSEAISDES
mgnify:CR=1 FL=1